MFFLSLQVFARPSTLPLGRQLSCLQNARQNSTMTKMNGLYLHSTLGCRKTSFSMSIFWALPLSMMFTQLCILLSEFPFHSYNPPMDRWLSHYSSSCIAISGLASHPFGSWKQRDEPDQKSNFMWLRDQLPKELQRVRSIIYGYDTRLVMSESFQTIDDLALSFIQRLESIGQSLISAKPLVFLAHSLGGIVLKQALVKMANSTVKEKFMLDYVLQVFSFGVPNRGMQISHILPMVSGKPNSELVEALSETSTYLSTLDEQFSDIAHLWNINLISIHETKRSRTVEVNRPSANYRMLLIDEFFRMIVLDNGQGRDRLRC